MEVAGPELAQLLRAGAAGLPGDSPRHDAELLLGHAAGRDRAWLYAHARDRADTALRARYAGLLQRREAGEPVAYLVGRRPFWTLELQ
ncbi:MAG TPA: protein-(glutamine-N5) methyltransferase, release factor-specific, partial [Xanthomonadaceae bacterium]|nr:protein-(glutamine-N5) methyltransferase, release factor-specific [Xanthomonadaceae bacterium]